MGGAAVIDAAKVIAAIAYADKDPHKAAKRLLAAASKPRYFLLQSGYILVDLCVKEVHDERNAGWGNYETQPRGGCDSTSRCAVIALLLVALTFAATAAEVRGV